ncbi:two-component system, sensor histidine kinase [Gammaproteobacteria bacterium]
MNAPSNLTAKSTILIVDDTIENIYLVASALDGIYRIRTASNGDKCLKIAFSDTPPDLILLDIMMPEMDGYEVCRQLKKNQATCNIPIIFLTARHERKDEQQGLELGAVDYITKPINLPILRARIKTHLALYHHTRVLEHKVAERTADLENLYKDSQRVLEKLCQNQERLAEAQRRAQLGNWEWDIQKDSFYWSDELFNLFGVKPDNFFCNYQTFLDYVHPDERNEVNHKIQATLQGTPCQIDLRIVRPDGHERILLTFGEVQFDKEGHAIKLVGTSQDITNLRKNEEELRKLSRVVAQSPEAIVITDLKGNIEYINDAFVESSGYPRDELISKGLKILKSGLTPPETYASLWNALDQGCAWHGEFINRRKNGEIYYENATISPVRQPNGRITHYAAVQENNTEKRRMFEEIERYRHHLEDLVVERTDQLAEARERAEAANRAKTTFLANMSHEIRTPLTAIIGFAESMLEDNQPLAERIDAIHTIVRNGRHLQHLISDILDFSKIEADRLEIEQTQIQLLNLLMNIHALERAQASDKGLEFSLHYLPPLPAVIVSDPTRLKQILINLIGNAIKFTSSPGAVRWIVSLDKQNTQLMFSIQDTGIGMTEAEIQSLFKPFVQADISTTRRFGGTGLGLTISRALAQRMGGDIQVISEKDHGSLFVVTLPIGPLEGVALIDKYEEFSLDHDRIMVELQAPCLTGRILVAEDNLDNQKLISLLIRKVHAEIVVAVNGQQAVERAQIEDFDLVLMDMQMPVMGGIEATELLRLTGFDRPIIALTANATEFDKAQARDAGCNGFLTKPIDQEAFFSVLRRYLPKSDSVKPTTNITTTNLSSLKDNPEFQEMRNNFVRELPTKLRNIEIAYQSKDWSVVSGLAHQLKGVATTFGFPDMTRIAGDLEFQVLRGDYDPVGYLIPELMALCPHHG